MRAIQRAAFLAVYLAVVAFAFVFVWFVGHRGVFLLDQSILFDGAWRVFQGQVPYRDFYSAFPPVAFFIQALFFRIAGVDFSAMVLAAAVLNGLAAACVIWISRRLHPGQPAMAIAGGLITAVWFEGPFGTLFFEQTAFFFNLVALTLLVEALGARPTSTWLRIGAGMVLGVSLLSKQNAGLEFIPIALGVAAWPYLPSMRKAAGAIAQTLAGLIVAFGCFGLWLWQFSSPGGFWYGYIALTRQIGVDRVRPLFTLLEMLALIPTLPYVALALLALMVGFVLSRKSSLPAGNRSIVFWIVLGCVAYQNLFKLHSDNESENALPYLGLVHALAFGFALEAASVWAVLKEGRDRGRKSAVVYVCLGLILLSMPFRHGLRISWSRKVIEYWTPATFDRTLDVPGMSRVRWGEPTIINQDDGTKLTQEEFEGLNRFLASMDANFFVWVDSTMLYGLHHRVSPTPWLYFSPGHSFLKSELPMVDLRVVQALIRNDVRIVVLEKSSWLGNEVLLGEMPKLRGWIEDNFEKAEKFGIFEVWLDRRLTEDRAPGKNP
jgi:4-amino-4-deoxy-L-arabinose transferase-like glycosyltransferase